MSALDAGLRLQQRYTLLARIGSGGMSEVWHAEDEVLGRPVAVKALSPRLAEDQALRAGVRAEARAVAKLDHPHITRVYDYGETVLPDGTHLAYLVMELVQGQTLAARLVSGPLPWPAAVQLTAQVAAALAEAHRAGLVHRDVKPGNVMLTAHGAKVLDFGIAAVARPAPPRPSHPPEPRPPDRRPPSWRDRIGPVRHGDQPQAGPTRRGDPPQADPARRGDSPQADPIRRGDQPQADPARRGDPPQADPARYGDSPRIGTPAYAAPEWLVAAPPDPAADVYGLGALLYEALTDHPTIRARNWADAARAHRAGPPLTPPEVPGLPAKVSALCMACLAPAPEDRPEAAEVAAALRAVLRGAGYRSLGRNRSAKAGSAASVAGDAAARRRGTPGFRESREEDDTAVGNGHWRAEGAPPGDAGPAPSNRGWFGRWATRNRLAARTRPAAPPGPASFVAADAVTAIGTVPAASITRGPAVSLAADRLDAVAKEMTTTVAAPLTAAPGRLLGRTRSGSARHGHATRRPARLLAALTGSVRRGRPRTVPATRPTACDGSRPAHLAPPAERADDHRSLWFALLAMAVAIVVALTFVGAMMVSREPAGGGSGTVPPPPTEHAVATTAPAATARTTVAPATKDPTGAAGPSPVRSAQTPLPGTAPPPPASDPGAVADEFERQLGEAARDGRVRSDVALDLRNGLNALRQRIDLGQVNELRYGVDQLRHKIDVRLTEHAIDPPTAGRLDSLLGAMLP